LNTNNLILNGEKITICQRRGARNLNYQLNSICSAQTLKDKMWPRASELLSHKVAEALRKYIDTPDAHRLAGFIELVNNWFDLMNSRQTTVPENDKETLRKP
jgi:hypothetical protein